MGFCVGRKDIKDKNLIVVDLGGGTFDVTVLTYDGRSADVKATVGDTHLGGQDFDNCVVDFCVDNFNQSNGIDIRNNKKAMLRLMLEVEKCKRVLSTNCPEIEINVDCLSGENDFSYSLTRTKFE